MRTLRDRETRIKDGMILCRLIAAKLSKNEKPTFRAISRQFNKPIATVLGDVDLYLAEGSDEDLILSITNWRKTSNRAVPIEQQEALVDLYAEIRDGPSKWGFSNERDLSAALGLPAWTLKTWYKKHRPDDPLPFEFNVRVYFDEYVDAGLLQEALGPDKFHAAERDIQSMRLDLLSERLEAIREIN